MPKPHLKDLDYQPHWLWAITLVLAPLILIAVSILGIPVGSSVPFGVTEVMPIVAVLIAVGGMIVALVRRNKILIGIATIGLLIGGGGLLFLLWVT